MKRTFFLSSVTIFFLFLFASAEAKQDINDQNCIDFKPDISLVAPDHLSDLTFGFSWDFECKGSARKLFEFERERSDWSFDHRLIFKSDGALLFQDELNRDPIQLSFAYDIGFQARPVSGTVDPNILSDSPDIHSLPWWGHFRFAFYLEGGAETDQGWNNPLFRAGPSIWLLNLSESSKTALLPTLSIGLNAVYSLKRPEIQDIRIHDWYARFHIMSRHEMNLSIIGDKLSKFNLIGVLQFSKDVGQIEEVNDQDLDTAFGWFADLSYAIRTARGREITKRADLFVRFSDGRIAPLLDDTGSFKFGLRLIF